MAKWRLATATATFRRHLQSQSPTISAFKDPTKSLSSAAAHQCRSYSTAQTDDSRGKWLTLPPFSPTVNGTAVGKELTSDGDSIKGSTDGSNTTALRWILRCRPDLPRTLIQKLFRLRQVRREMSLSCDGDELQRSQLKRVAAKESLNVGDRIYLPLSVDDDAPPPPAKKESFRCSEEERKFVCSLVLYKDPAIIVLNKPHGMAVQGGTGIKTSIDELAATCLTFDKSESPRLVHRLDRDCSGLLVLARTQTAATVLHSIFREKTSGASAYGVKKNIKSLKRKYMALVIGCPRRQRGQISAPLRKVVVDDGKSDRITVNDNGELVSTQHAITEYRVIESSPHGYTWLELRPLTGRKHQLRVHCAEVLGTPILGDYKYGWQAHKTREPFVSSGSTPTKPSSSSFGLDIDGGDVSSKQPHLHLHSKQIDLPNISQLLEKMQKEKKKVGEKKALGWAARDPSGVLAPYSYTLRSTGADDVYIKVICCGICHTDIHQIKNDLGMSNYPMVPGHEVVGEVMEVGSDVSTFTVGDVVGVGVVVGSCGSCKPCSSELEQYCNKRIWSYNDVYTDGKPTQGGFADTMIVNQKFVVKIPEGMAVEQAAPLLCAGVTVYSPLSHFGLMASGLKGGILGLGGVGHMGVKIAKAMGHHVTVISSSNKKKEEAIEHLGADDYVVSSDPAEMQRLADSLDYIIDTVPVFHPLEPYLACLKLDGKLILMGVINTPLQFLTPLVILGRKVISGSFIGSIKETEEVLAFYKEKGLTSTIEVVKMDELNTAFERLHKNDVRYRFVVNVAGSNLVEEAATN